MRHGAEDVKGHGFFAKINWRRLERKLLQAPYLPPIKGPMDSSNFVVEEESPYYSSEHMAANTPGRAQVFKDW